MFNEYLMRKLAKSDRWQNIFSAAKEVNGITLFNNTKEFSQLQEFFLTYLYFYYNLLMDISIHKLSKKILENEIYEDAYALWKREKGYNKKDNNFDKKKDLHLVFTKEKLKFKEKQSNG
jgi:hypothetical protein